MCIMAPYLLYIIMNSISLATLFIIVKRGEARNIKTKELCDDIKCDSSSNMTACGVRFNKTTVRLKQFKNECDLLRYGCSHEDEYAYGLINMEYCERLLAREVSANGDGVIEKESKEYLIQSKEALLTGDLTGVVISKKINLKNSKTVNLESNGDQCENNCSLSIKDEVCGIQIDDSKGYRIRLFKNKCDFNAYNCKTDVKFIQTDLFICEGAFRNPYENMTENDINNNITNYKNLEDNIKALKNSSNIIVVDSSMLGPYNDINETIDNFFAATHVLDLPIKQMDEREMTRRNMMVKNVAAVTIFQPWITIPKKILTDYYHTPTLSTCYHKCPTKCPDTYAPVCGVPGIKAREPSLMFKNHCYMDVAQCKMFWEDKSSTAVSSAYIESSFMFCLGDQLNGLYRFLPLIRTLQHMGRLKKKGKFRYKLKNMRFFNNLALNEPKLMG